MSEVPPPPRRGSFLQAAWIGAILLALAAFAFFPQGRGPRVVAVWPGRGPAAKPRGWEEARAAWADRREEDRGAVVFAGDSAFAAWDGLADAFPRLRVANRAIRADTSRALLLRFNPDVASLSPRAVVLAIGASDLTLDADPGDVAVNVRAMLDLLPPGTPAVLCAVLPRTPRPGRFPDRILDLNARLRALAAVRPGVAWCDLYEPLATEVGGAREEDVPDGEHLSASGYAKVGTAVGEALAGLKVE